MNEKAIENKILKNIILIFKIFLVVEEIFIKNYKRCKMSLIIIIIIIINIYPWRVY